MIAIILASALDVTPIQTLPAWTASVDQSGWTYVDTVEIAVVLTRPALGAPRPGFPKFWLRFEYMPGSVAGQLSAAGQEEFDCDKGAEKSSAVKSYAGRNLTGQVIEVPDDASWNPIRPGSPLATIYKTVCPGK